MKYALIVSLSSFIARNVQRAARKEKVKVPVWVVSKASRTIWRHIYRIEKEPAVGEAGTSFFNER